MPTDQGVKPPRAAEDNRMHLPLPILLFAHTIIIVGDGGSFTLGSGLYCIPEPQDFGNIAILSNAGIQSLKRNPYILKFTTQRHTDDAHHKPPQVFPLPPPRTR